MINKMLYVLLFFCFNFQVVKAERIPSADVSVMVIDMKYNKKQGVKICEIQQFFQSRFKGYKKLHGNSEPIADQFCDYIDRYMVRHQENRWFIDKEVGDKVIRHALNRRWIPVDNIDDLYENADFLQAALMFPNDPQKIKDYNGVIYARPCSIGSLESFRQCYPGILVIDSAHFPFWWNKCAMSYLFQDDPVIARLKPRWNVYNKEMPVEQLFEAIVQDINSESDIYVIKPIAAAKGNGIIIVSKEDLETTLDLIFNQQGGDADDPSYNYWKKANKRTQFIVEEFIHSEPVYLLQSNNQPYDGTIRYVCFLSYSEGIIDIKFPACYWKFPDKALTETGTLNEKHKSSGYQVYENVSESIKSDIEKQLTDSLPKLYLKMLKHDYVSDEYGNQFEKVDEM